MEGEPATDPKRKPDQDVETERPVAGTAKPANGLNLVPAATMYQLPPELTYLILGHLDLHSLLRCQRTCHSWMDILAGQAAQTNLWTRAPIQLKGTLLDIDVKLKNCLKLSPSPSALSLEILRPTYVSNLALSNWPTGIRELRIGTSSRTDYHILLELVSRCKHLKLLHWVMGEEGESKQAVMLRDIYSLPLPRSKSQPTHCRLDELIFNFRANVYIDAAFFQMSSQVRRLSVFDGLTQSDVTAMLTKAKEFLEELNVTKVSQKQYRCFGGQIAIATAKTSGLVMSRLKKLCLRTPAIGLLLITAPQAKEVRFDNGAYIDWTLLDSCRRSIKSLHLGLKDTNDGGRLDRELFDMPQLEALHLDYEASTGLAPAGKIRSLREVSTYAFWNAVKSNNIAALASTMPKLKTLTICHDPLLNEAVIIKYIEIRYHLRQPTLESMHVRLAKNCSFQTGGLDRLQETMPGFTYQFSEYWNIGTDNDDSEDHCDIFEYVDDSLVADDSK